MAGNAKVTIKGGEKAAAYLKDLEQKLKAAPTIRVGFLDGATYANGMNTASVALIQEFGATINMPARTQTVYRKLNSKGTGFLRKGRFVKKSQSNYNTQHQVASHTITIPPAHFFRDMINKNEKSWGPMAANLLRANKFDVVKVAGLMGAEIKAELQQSIRDCDIPNAPSTIRKKGFDNRLIDTGFMLQHVDYEIK